MDYKEFQPGMRKLVTHLEHLLLIKNGVPTAPLHVSVWPTLRCQCRCEYCCCRNEDPSANELSFEDFIHAVNVFSKWGCKAIEFSGGGEPLLWPHFNEAAEYARERGLKVSLVTNGYALEFLSPGAISALSWIRVSIQSVQHGNALNLRCIPKEKLSFSHICTNPVELVGLGVFALRYHVPMRVAVPRPEGLVRAAKVRELAEEIGDPLFFTDKEPGIPKGCYMPWLRAAIDWNGNFLPCPATQMTQAYSGKIGDAFKLCHVNDLEEWISSTTPHDLGFRCDFCNCGKQMNDMVDDIIKGIKDAEFV